jgi:hypothetical protein
MWLVMSASIKAKKPSMRLAVEEPVMSVELSLAPERSEAGAKRATPVMNRCGPRDPAPA